MIGAIEVIAGLGWDPEIRGLLTVVLGMAVLGGSVWLLLVTNTGTRLGSLIALAGFWGWMFVMGIFWWIYGIGWAGSLPTWEVQDVFIDAPGAEADGLQAAFIGKVSQLPDNNCFDGVDSFPPADGVASVTLDSGDVVWSLCSPRAVEVLMAYPEADRNAIAQELINPQTEAGKLDAIAIDTYGYTRAQTRIDGNTTVKTCNGAVVDTDAVLCRGLNGLSMVEMLESRSPSERDAMFDDMIGRRVTEITDATIAANVALGPDDPRYLDSAALDAAVQENIENAMLRIDEISLSQLEALAPQVPEWAEDEGILQLGDWTLQSTSQSGEAAATADAFIREDLFPDGNFLVLEAYQEGGKPKRDGTDMWTRITHKISSTARITHPTNYTVVNVQQTLDKVADPSKPPPIPEIDPEASTYSVVMTRNLGNLRLIPGLFTFVSLLLFLATAAVLHWRDLALREKGLDV